MAGRTSFAFVMVRTPPDRAPEFDTMWRYAAPYTRFRHPDDRYRRHWVLCARDALTIMTQTLRPARRIIGEVHVYLHGTSLGTTMGRLKTGDEDYRFVTVDDARKFRNADDKVAAMGGFGDSQTRVYLHGCNLGNSPDGLLVWRDIFGGPKALACAPTLYQEFCAGPLQLEASCPGSREPFLVRDISCAADVEAYIREALEKGRELCRSLRPGYERQFRKQVEEDLGKQLVGMFQRLKAGGEVDWPEAEAANRMRALFEQARGVPITFLCSEPRQAPAFGSACSEKQLKNVRGIEVYFPWDTDQWRAHHHWEPHPPP